MEANEQNCPTCGTEIPEDAPGGHCPECALNPTRVADNSAAPDWLKDAAWLREALPDYELISEIGRGGMGRVLKGRHKGLDRLVAIKILLVDLAQHDDFILRFQREARAMAKLQHPNIVQVHDFGERENACYIVMEFVEGVNLRHLINDGNLSPEQALTIVPQICDALQYAHDQGIVHRDIKPANVIVGTDGSIKVADFGLAKVVPGDDAVEVSLTQTGLGMGTAGYMSPEQEKDVAHVDHRTDIYSLGIMFYEMLTGERPRGRWMPPSKRVKVDVSIDEVVLKSMEYEPERRYQQASEVKTALEHSSVVRKGHLKLAQRRWFKAPLVLAVCMLLGGLGWWQRDRMAEMFADQESQQGPKSSAEAAIAQDRLAGEEAGLLDIAGDKALLEAHGGSEGVKLQENVFGAAVSAYEDAQPGDGLTFNLNGRVQLELVWVPAGHFIMGTPEDELNRDPEEQQHEVEITRGFWMGKYEVTQAQYQAVTGKTPSYHTGDDLPVEKVNWEEATGFCKALKQAGDAAYADWHFRLPTEAEWEYACRAGTQTATAFGDSLSSMQANFNGGYPYNGAAKGPFLQKTVDVGSYRPNAWGLYDMHSNVREWCADWYEEEYYAKSPKQDPYNVTATQGRCLRGGGWYNRGDLSRTGKRDGCGPVHRDYNHGFRVVLSPRP